MWQAIDRDIYLSSKVFFTISGIHIFFTFMRIPYCISSFCQALQKMYLISVSTSQYFIVHYEYNMLPVSFLSSIVYRICRVF